MNTPTIELRVQELQKELEAWARKNGLISQTQHIYLSAAVLDCRPDTATEVREMEKSTVPDLLEMQALDFFTKERFEVAGVETRVTLTKARNFLSNTRPGMTLRDLASKSRSQMFLYDNLGPKTRRAMQKVLLHYGIRVEWEG